MNRSFSAAMRRAAVATRAMHVLAATRIIQKSLAGVVTVNLRRDSQNDPAVSSGALSDTSDRLRPAKTAVKASKTKGLADSADPVRSATRVPARFRLPLGETIKSLVRNSARISSGQMRPLPNGTNSSLDKAAIPTGANFVWRSFACKQGMRDFKLYIPASAPANPKGLVLMLHGCTQNADDFAAGTSMNSVAEANGLLLAYPVQTRASNASSCWNWFEGGHQIRDCGEPAILAGLARSLMKEFAIGKGRVYVAGLSAGAAMAVILGETYPEIFKAIGVHSGLPYQSAGNVVSALAAMRGTGGSLALGKTQPRDRTANPVRTIIFHGSADRTVLPANASRIFDAVSSRTKGKTEPVLEGSANGRNYTRTVVVDPSGYPLVESWVIDGAGHAWSGGSASGTYTDTRGPDASREMVRFFLQEN